jgi:hypothetical protein
MSSVGENGIYIHTGDSLSLDGIGTGTLWTSAFRVVVLSVNVLVGIKSDVWHLVWT